MRGETLQLQLSGRHMLIAAQLVTIYATCCWRLT